uniref:Ubiquitin n=1 Tax=Musca domestica TaxID=7370 RepID=T1PKJ6_MUSDO
MAPINLNISTTTGGNFSVSVDPQISVENLKKIIAKKLKVAKDRICLLHREKELQDGSLKENNLMDGSKIILIPNVETGLLAQRPENTVMQALESLNDAQVNDFLSGKTPLNLSMRLGDHMMLIQLQLSTVNPVNSAAHHSGSNCSSSSSRTRSSHHHHHHHHHHHQSNSLGGGGGGGSSAGSSLCGGLSNNSSLSESDKIPKIVGKLGNLDALHHVAGANNTNGSGVLATPPNGLCGGFGVPNRLASRRHSEINGMTLNLNSNLNSCSTSNVTLSPVVTPPMVAVIAAAVPVLTPDIISSATAVTASLSTTTTPTKSSASASSSSARTEGAAAATTCDK